MSSSTIDFGIDLGTTNSTVARIQGTGTEVFKNNDGSEQTPSVVHIDRMGRVRTGPLAAGALLRDSANSCSEFKLQMGTDWAWTFPHTGAAMRAEQLSAEVLKSLRADVRTRTGEDLSAAVITVPAAFELPQCDATSEAARLAGLQQSPLLQEPVAAALAYGFQSQRERAFWMVFDFGGGTFDAAVVSFTDGIFQVVNHSGDNHLGGKLIDWGIVEQLLVPALLRERRLTGFRRGNPEYQVALAKLKLAAERAKIRLSACGATEVAIDYLCQDDHGDPVEFVHELTRADVERIQEPFVVRAINLARRALQQERLGPADVEKLLLIGGPTMSPHLRQMLADPVAGLGIPLETRGDPLTVVARGAAIFAATQRTEGVEAAPVSAGVRPVELEYEPVGADPEPFVAGRVEGDGLAGYTVEFEASDRPVPWSSGRYELSDDGTFATSLWAERGQPNRFDIVLRDPSGARVPTRPDHLTYTIGAAFSEQILIHGIGVLMAGGQMDVFMDKGTPLPARRRAVHRTVWSVRAGSDGDLIRIPVMEGENVMRGDRNRLIGSLEIPASQVRRDVPAGSEVEITIEVDRSRLVSTRAWIPILDQEFEQPLVLRKAEVDLGELRQDVEREKKRLMEVRERVDELGADDAGAVVERIEREQMLWEVEGALEAAASDRDAADKCRNRLLDLMTAVDEMEDATEWPALVAQAVAEIETERKLVETEEFEATDQEKQAFQRLVREVREAIDARQPDLLRRRIDELDTLGFLIIERRPEWWSIQLDRMAEKRDQMSDGAAADLAISSGRRALDERDTPALKTAVRNLARLLPAGDPDRTSLGTTQR